MINPIQDEYGLVWNKDDSKYIYRTSFKAPDKIDQIFLYCWLMESQKNKWSQKINLSGYRILKKSGFNDSKRNYDRLEDSFWRWKGVTVGFKNSFYNPETKEYRSKIFGIIENIDIAKGNIEITFNENFLRAIQYSNYCKYVNFEEIKKLRNPTASRLHEILSKNFKSRNKWSIDVHKLANKIPIQEQYLTHILAKIKPAINQINDKTTLNINLEVRKKERGKAILIFRTINLEIEPKNQKSDFSTAGITE